MEKIRALKFSIAVVTLITVVSFQNCAGSGPLEAKNQNTTVMSSEDLLESKAFEVINNRCVACHNPANPNGGIDYITNLDSLLYYQLVIPGEPQLSPLYAQIQSGRMPPTGALSSAEIKAVYNWIQDGFKTGTGPVTPPPPSQNLEAKFSSIHNLILKPKCLVCHSSNNSMGGVNFSTYDSTKNTVQPADPNASSMYTAVNSGRMPKSGNRLTTAEVNAIRTWIQNGALNN